MTEVKMPVQWTDADGWERYYAALYPDGNYRENSRRLGSLQPEQFRQIVEHNTTGNTGGFTVWVSGCGVSAMPRTLAAMGLTVYATDIAPTAIAFQQSTDNDAAGLVPADLLHPGGSLTCSVHDMRTPYLDGAFQLILNVKAMQGFDRETMRRIATVHYQALRPEGGQAVFDTMNVQGELRDTLEESLVDAGFFLPFYQLDRWYRAELNTTGIEYVIILDRPFPAYRDAFEQNPELRQQEVERLHAIATEYTRRREAAIPEEQQRAKAATHFAHVIYSTG